jgi:putative photosynthetic complex assembly protein 2
MAAAAFTALGLWWGSTQVLLWLVRLASHRAQNLSALVLGLVSAAAAVAAAQHEGVAAVYAGFVAALGLWGAFEIAFLSGAVLGIDSKPTGPGLARRAWAAFRAIVWHELALVGTLAALAVATAGAPNRIALWSFAMLWAMRASAKLNLFLGVRNLCTEFLPPSVAHLARHFRRAPINGLFPVSVLAGTLAAAFFLRAGLDPAAAPGEAVAMTLLAALTTFGTLEHWLMLTPLSPLKLWSTQPSRVTLARPVGATG